MRSEPVGDGADCLLLNTTGELQSWYSIATIVFMGKSLTARGGQNPVEPILAGKPVLFGPHMENFSTLARALVVKAGAIQVDGPTELENKIAWLLRDGGAASRLVANARAVLAPHSGATERTAAIVMQLRSHH
jgi:3-deoxy-D-manno-octulosonic-acid transferase